jgi:hypothetical protein
MLHLSGGAPCVKPEAGPGHHCDVDNIIYTSARGRPTYRAVWRMLLKTVC